MAILSQQILETFDRNGTDKGSPHGYSDIYAAIPSDITSLLEIGVWEGASLKSWLEIFPQAHIHGIDLRLANISNPRITQIHSDICDLDVVNYPKWDVIIDDGSHIVSDVLLAWDKLRHRWNKAYIIEDVLNPDPITNYIAKTIKADNIKGCWSIEVINTGVKNPDDRVIRISKV